MIIEAPEKGAIAWEVERKERRLGTRSRHGARACEQAGDSGLVSRQVLNRHLSQVPPHGRGHPCSPLTPFPNTVPLRPGDRATRAEHRIRSPTTSGPAPWGHLAARTRPRDAAPGVTPTPIRSCPQGLPLTSAAARLGLRAAQPPESVCALGPVTLGAPAIPCRRGVGRVPWTHFPCVDWLIGSHGGLWERQCRGNVVVSPAPWPNRSTESPTHGHTGRRTSCDPHADPGLHGAPESTAVDRPQPLVLI